MAIQSSSLSPEAPIFRIPDVLDQWPWPARVSPHLDKVNVALDKWLEGFPQIDAKMLKMLEQGESGKFLFLVVLMVRFIDELSALFVSWAYPTMDEGVLNLPFHRTTC